MGKVPLIEVQSLSEWGDLREQAAFYDPNGMDQDLTYVPGFGELRREHEIKKAEYFRGECRRSDVPLLPVNLVWVRSQTKAGEPDNMKTFAQGRLGYRLVTKDDIGQPWLTELPGSAQQHPDGSIRNGDTVLMVADAPRVARNEMHQRLATEARLDASVGGFAQAIEEARRTNPGLNTKGLDPKVEVLPPTEREASLPPQPVSVSRPKRD